MTEVDDFLDNLDRLAGVLPTHDPDAFYRQLLPAAAGALGAEAADFEGMAGRPVTVRWPFKRPDSSALLSSERRDRVVADAAPRILTAEGEGTPVVACPVEGASSIAGVLAFALSVESATSVERSLELAGGIAEIASRYELRVAAERVAGDQRRLARVEESLLRLHSAGSASEVARQAVNEGRRLLECDRLAILTRRGDSWRVEAVSGVDRISRRSDAARRMAEVVRVTIRDGEPVATPTLRAWSDTTDDIIIKESIDAYQEATGVRALRIQPCRRSPDAEGFETALLAEWYDERHNTDTDPLLAALSRHVGVAMGRADGRAGLRGRLSRLAIGLGIVGLLAAAAVCATIVQATLWVTADGQFQPADRASLFAPLDAVVEEVLVDEAERVVIGQPVVRLDSPQLRVQREEVAEAIAATKAELATIETAKLRASLPGPDTDAGDATSLASRSAALSEKLKHQEARRQLLEEQAKELVVTSPIVGTVLSWRPQDLLADRPVSRGQRLLEVAGGERWRLELEVPDHRSGHLLQARTDGEPLSVEYVVRSSPAQTHLGIVESIGEATLPGADGLPVVRVVVMPEAVSATNPRTGLGVSAKIDCGEYSLGYVWLHEAIAAVRRWWF